MAFRARPLSALVAASALAAVVLAGCASSASASEEAAVPEGRTSRLPGEGGPSEPRTFEASYTFRLTQVGVAGSHVFAPDLVSQGRNCLHLDDPAEVLAGTARVEWPQGAVPVPMEAFLTNLGDRILAHGVGTSVVEFDLAGMQLPGQNTRLLWQLADEVPVGAAFEVEATATLSMTYRSPDPAREFLPADALGVCSVENH